MGDYDNLPHEDISGEITSNLIKNLRYVDYQVHLELINSVNKTFEAANKHIQPDGTVELLEALQANWCNSNKNVVMITPATIENFISTMGPPVSEK